MSEQKVLVLGCTGMLGSMVAEHLIRQKGTDLVLAARDPSKWKTRAGREVPVEPLELEGRDSGDKLGGLLKRHKPDYVINCVGITKPYCKDNDRAGRLRAVKINALFPYTLQEAAAVIGAKVIQIATDCVYSGAAGNYTEDSPHDALDVYGKTKSLGEVEAPNMLHIRCSIIGPEKYNKAFLLEWFLALPEGSEAKGFAHHRWNGVTTLQFAELCLDIVHGRRGLSFQRLADAGSLHHYVPNETVNKFDLLHLFCEVYGKTLNVARVDRAGPAVDRTLATRKDRLPAGGQAGSMKAALQALRDYTQSTGFYP